MRIHKEGYKMIPLVFAVIIIFNLIVWLIGFKWLFVVLLIPSLIFMALTVWFFRDPQPTKKYTPGQVLSVADGKVVVIEPVFEKEYFKDERIQVSVFMSVFNVHVNHVPANGEVSYYKYHPGKYLMAHLPKSSELNERATTVVRTHQGTEILIRQIAGLVARRVVTYIKPGEEVTVNDQLGFIRFGSRIDLFFPKGTEIPVKINQIVKGGITVLGILPEE